MSNLAPPRLLAFGHGPSKGDADGSLVVRYLGYDVDRGVRSQDSVGIAWFHEVPYYPLHPHLARLFQESISEARQLRYETGLSDLDKDTGIPIPGGKLSLAFELAEEIVNSQSESILFIVVAQNARKEEAVHLVRSKLKSSIDSGRLTLLGTRGTIERIADKVWNMTAAKGWVAPELLLHRPIVEDIGSLWASCQKNSLNLVCLGSTSGTGDLDVVYYISALAQLREESESFWAGAIWLHSVPYSADRRHYLLHFQERLTESNLPYRTSIDGALDLLKRLSEELPQREKGVLIISAADTMKPALRFLLHGARDSLVSEKLMVVATPGTAAAVQDLADRGFP